MSVSRVPPSEYLIKSTHVCIDIARIVKYRTTITAGRQEEQLIKNERVIEIYECISEFL